MAKQPTVGDHLARLYQDWQMQGRKSIGTMTSHARPIEAYFAKRVASSVKPDDLRGYVALRQKAGKANGTINRELSVLRTALMLAYDVEELDRIPKFPTLKEENVRQGVYTRDEVTRLMAELPAHYQPVVMYGYLTGRRKGEMLQLRWDDVDLKARTITVRQSTTKTGAPDTIPLEGELLELLLDLWEHTQKKGCPWVFHRNGQPIEDFRRTFDRAAPRAGLEGKLFHDLRRSMATDATEAGVDQATIMRLTGHKTTTVFQRYRIVKSEGVRNAMHVIEEYRKRKTAE